MTGLDIQTYNQKRDFTKTKEPRGETKKRKGDSFVVQKHAASRLHYDFRLEMDGVLKSWAVTKGPSLDPADRRLAVRTEDHPISYGGFEGTIPQGEYGGGTVMLWDLGHWTPIGDPHAGLKKGHLHFELHGERLSGKWNLIRMHGGDNDRRENWLLIKEEDDVSVERGSGSTLLDDNMVSVKTGATMEEIAGGDLEWTRTGARKKKPDKKAKSAAVKKKPGQKSKTTVAKLAQLYPEVQLATLVTEPPASAGWVHEVKFDGYRVLCFVAGGEVMIRTRNGNDWTSKFPSLARALAELDVADAVLDGEAVVTDDKGTTSFQKLQNALGTTAGAESIQAYFFDLLHLNGEDLSRKTLLERKKPLEKLLGKSKGILHYSEHMQGSADLLMNACKIGLEGIISKQADASYATGRGRGWLKSKCNKRQEFVIIGFTGAKKGDRALGALHLGYYSEGELKYAGKCGTGFTHKHAEEIFNILKPLARKDPPAKVTTDAKRGATWVEPKILCEASFTEWTGDGHIRHPSFEGLRADKQAKDVVHEEAMPTKQAVEPAAPKSRKKGPTAAKSKKPAKGDALVVQDITITNPDRVIFKDVHVTKGELAEYYGQVAPFMMKQLAGYPLSLLRCPGGADAQCFFQRNPDQYMKNYVKPFPWDHKGNHHEYLYIEDPKGLVFLAQMGVIEMHPWGAPVKRIDYPTRMIFDLDPDEGIDFEVIKMAAMDVRQRLKALDIESFVKTTGGKGLHIVVPLDGKKKWPEVKDFAARFAQGMVNAVPDAYVATMTKAKRKGKIFIDYFRNDYTATGIADYSVRARKGAPVAVPLRWEELKTLKAASQFSLDDVLDRLKKKKDAKIMVPPQSLPRMQ
ncbi:MAG TPA: DNA ligase D [Patescibacteria group bacterium]|nr:DNA ligase D [Patescibacteria group bacterium]